MGAVENMVSILASHLWRAGALALRLSTSRCRRGPEDRAIRDKRCQHGTSPTPNWFVVRLAVGIPVGLAVGFEVHRESHREPEGKPDRQTALSRRAFHPEGSPRFPLTLARYRDGRGGEGDVESTDQRRASGS